MARFNFQCLILAYAVVMLFAVSEIKANEEKGCKGDLVKLGMECKKFILKDLPPMDPSKECCAQFQNADIPCMCGKVTKEIEKIVSMEKVVYVAKFCSCPLKSGSKCGSYTVPKA